jgi:hypothetical protein
MTIHLKFKKILKGTLQPDEPYFPTAGADSQLSAGVHAEDDMTDWG